jgi:hypothetical protein
MTRNSGRDWSEEDIQLLSCLMRDNVSMKHMRVILGRSENAIKHAVRNIMFHHLLDYYPDDVASMYNMSIDTLSNAIVPAKYNVPAPDGTAVIAHGDDEEVARPNSSACAITWAVTILGALCAGGLGVFTSVMGQEWHRLQSM